VTDVLGIAAVTETVVGLLHREADALLPGTLVTKLPPDAAREGQTGPQLNLFLYHIEIDAAWSNAPLPGIRNGEDGYPPLPLTLHYLVTAYGSDDQRLLAVAMLALHDHSILTRDLLRAALPESDLHRQAERVRVTPLRRTDADMSSLWMTRRTAGVFSVSPVLIESRRPSRTPLPVLVRGVGDVGVIARPNLLAPIPTLEDVTPQPAPAGATLAFSGHDLDGGTLQLRFTSKLGTEVLAPPVAAPSGRTFTAKLPDGVPPGIGTVAAKIVTGGRTRWTNDLPLIVRPAVTTTPLPLAAARDGAGRVTLTVGVAPAVETGQVVSLLVGSRAPVSAAAFTGPASALTFGFAVDAGDYPVRLRVDGVDSELVAATTPPSYDPDQRLVVT
jgi:hypothetical protein